jgi:Bacteriophage CI repressor helix-turn-helix domain
MTNKVFTVAQNNHMRKTLRLLDERVGRQRLGKRLGLAPQTISNLTQKQAFSRQVAEALAEFTGLTLEELLAGEKPRRCPTCGQAEEDRAERGHPIRSSGADARAEAEAENRATMHVAKWLRECAVELEREGTGPTGVNLNMIKAMAWREASDRLEKKWVKSKKLAG